MYVSTLESVN